MPMNPALYPPDWKAISRRIRFDRAGGKCEKCGVRHLAIGARDRHGAWHDEHDIDGMNSDHGYSLFGEYPKLIRIVLTTAHLDHDTTNNDDSNLMSLCQLCHNRHDAKHRTMNAAITRRKNRTARVGQMEMSL